MAGEGIVIITTREALRGELRKVLEEMGITLAPAGVVEKEPEELTTVLAKRYMTERGYKVVSDPAFKTLLKMYRIEPVKRGKDNWYKISELERIPKRL